MKKILFICITFAISISSTAQNDPDAILQTAIDCQSKADYAIETKDYETALDMYLKLKALFEKYLGKTNDQYITYSLNVATMYGYLGLHEKSD